MTNGSKREKPLWKRTWAQVSSGIFAVLLTVAGFASPEFRQQLCLDLPKAADLEYPAEPAGSMSFAEVGSNAVQKSLNGRDITFRARYYGEAMTGFFAMTIDRKRLDSGMLLNLRSFDFVPEETPFGSTAMAMPSALVIVPVDAAESLVGLPMGTVLEVSGKATYLAQPEPGSTLAISPGARPPDNADFYVTASKVKVVKASNRPQDRLLCRAFHGLKQS